jgi:hypothetical protein
LSPEEIVALRDWLNEHKDAELPAVSHLMHVVQGIIADQRVTAEERRELFIAIESVLPVDVRGIARTARRTVEEREKERLRIQREAEKQRSLEERERNEPIEHWDFMVAGSRHDGRPEIISEYARAGDSALLVRDPTNRYSQNAIEVRTASGHQIGFVPEEDAVDVAPLLDAGHPYLAKIKKILTGGRSPIPVVIAEIYRKGAAVSGLVQPGAEIPKAIHSGSAAAGSSSAARGGMYFAILFVGIIALIVTLIRGCG